MQDFDALDKSKLFTGWYYDDQQNLFNVSRLTTVSLHANSTYLPRITDMGYRYSEWSYDDPDPNNKDTLDHYPYGNIERDNEAYKDFALDNRNNQSGYFMEPLCTSIVSEDFGVSISNSWSEMGGDMIGGAWNNVKQYAPYAGAITQELGSLLSDVGSEMIKDKEGKTELSSWDRTVAKVGGLMKALGDKAKTNDTRDAIDDYLNRSLVMQGTRFSYYQGSSVNFGNLVMKFTIFPKWKIDKRDNKLKFYTVQAQLKELYPYFMGEYKDEELAGKLYDGLEQFIGWQLPPGGFRAAIKDVDNVQRGTLKLKVGSLYSVSNLVVENCQFNFSKQVCKCPDPVLYITDDPATGGKQKDIHGLISPLYCEITLTLKPVTKYSTQALRDFINGANMKHSKKSTSDLLVKNLENGRAIMKERYETTETILADQAEKFAKDFNKPITKTASAEDLKSWEEQMEEENKKTLQELTSQPEEIDEVDIDDMDEIDGKYDKNLRDPDYDPCVDEEDWSDYEDEDGNTDPVELPDVDPDDPSVVPDAPDTIITPETNPDTDTDNDDLPNSDPTDIPETGEGIADDNN